MNIKIIIVLPMILLAGCSFNDLYQTYRLTETLPPQLTQSKPYLEVKIAPTLKRSSIPLIYYSRKYVAPYHVLFLADSTSDVCTYFLLHGFSLKSEGMLIEEKKYPEPLKLDLCGSELGDRKNYRMYSHELNESFRFKQDQVVELEVDFESPNSSGLANILLRAKGKEQKRNLPFWKAMQQ